MPALSQENTQPLIARNVVIKNIKDPRDTSARAIALYE